MDMILGKNSFSFCLSIMVASLSCLLALCWCSSHYYSNWYSFTRCWRHCPIILLVKWQCTYGLDWRLWATTAQRSLWCNNSLLIWSSLPHVTSHSSMRCILTPSQVFLNDGIKPFRSFINEQAGWGLQCETWFGAIISSALSRFWPHAGCCLRNKNTAVILGEILPSATGISVLQIP